LLKIPAAFEHYAEHKNENPSLSFFTFLEIHYLHGSPKDKDYEKDMKLPFKTSCDCIFAVSTAVIPQTITFSFTKPIATTEKKNYIILNQCIPSAYLANIWQPPRFS
jgi:hypothetical protein